MKKTIISLFAALCLLFSVGFIASACGGAEAEPTGVTLNYTTKTLSVGMTVRLQATVTPEEGADKSVLWSSNDTAVATVDDSGLVTAVAEGSAAITVKTARGEFTRDCTINVVPKSLQSIEITALPDKTTYIAGEAFDSTGIEVSGTFTDGSKENVTSGCTFAPSGALTVTDTTITVTHVAADLTSDFTITVTEGNTVTVSDEGELTAALADEDVDRIVLAEGLAVSSLAVSRDVIIVGDLDAESISIGAGKKLVISGTLLSTNDLSVTGDGKIVVSGNIRGTNVTIGGSVELNINGLIDDAVYDETVEDIIYATSAIYTRENLSVNGATIRAFNNVFSRGTTTIDGGADVTVYGLSWCDNEEAYFHNDFGNGLQAVGGLTVEGKDTVVGIYNNTNVDSGKAGLQSDNAILISGATVVVDKPENATNYYSWGIWATHGNLTITDGAQVTCRIKTTDSDGESVGIGSTDNKGGVVTFAAGTGESVTKVEIFADRAIRKNIKWTGEEFMIFNPWE